MQPPLMRSQLRYRTQTLVKRCSGGITPVFLLASCEATLPSLDQSDVPKNKAHPSLIKASVWMCFSSLFFLAGPLPVNQSRIGATLLSVPIGDWASQFVTSRQRLGSEMTSVLVKAALSHWLNPTQKAIGQTPCRSRRRQLRRRTTRALIGQTA